jgi:hypothetical protein
MLDLLERQWHTASITTAIQGGAVEDWGTLQERFDAYLSGKEVAQSKLEEMRGLLGLPGR